MKFRSTLIALAISTALPGMALAELRKRSDEAQAVMHELLIEGITKLAPDQRRKFLEAAMQRGPRSDRPPPLGGPPSEGPPE